MNEKLLRWIYSILRWLSICGPKPVRNFISAMEHVELESYGQSTLWDEITGAVENLWEWQVEDWRMGFENWYDRTITEPYYTWKFRLFVWCSEDPKIAIIARAYMDNERVVVPEGPEGTYTLDQVVEHSPELTWDKCDACRERESFFQAMSLREMGEYIPEWAAGVLAKYEPDDVPLPGCEHEADHNW